MDLGFSSFIFWRRDRLICVAVAYTPTSSSNRLLTFFKQSRSTLVFVHSTSMYPYHIRRDKPAAKMRLAHCWIIKGSPPPRWVTRKWFEKHVFYSVRHYEKISDCFKIPIDKC